MSARLDRFGVGSTLLHTASEESSIWVRYDSGWRQPTEATWVGYDDRWAQDCLDSGFADLVLGVSVTPAIDLPTEPTFGLLTWTAGRNTQHPGEVRTEYAEWFTAPCISGWAQGTKQAQVHAPRLGLQVPVASVTAFTPATLVPTEALDRFVETVRTPHSTLGNINFAARRLIDAIEKAAA